MPAKEKIEKVESLSEQLKEHDVIYLLSYKGIKANDDNKMRRELEKKDIKYSVVKNTLMKRALKNNEIDSLDEFLAEDTSLALGDDLVEVVKTFDKFNEEFGKPIGQAIYYEGNVFSGDQLEEISNLPSKEELYTRLVTGAKYPITATVNSLSGIMKKLVFALNDLSKNKSSEEKENQ